MMDLKLQRIDKPRSLAIDNLVTTHEELNRQQPPVKANDIQHGGDHYKDRVIEPWDYVAANELCFFTGNAVKYLTRWRSKGGVTDLKKAKHYIDKLIEIEQAKESKA